MTAKRMWALPGASYTLDVGIMILGGQGKVTIPSPCYLIEHERGLVLFDTGLTPDAVGDPVKVFGALAEEVGMTLTEDQCVDNQIRALGLRPEQVTHVVASHVHLDHSGGLRLFPDARFYAGAGELPYAFWPLPAGAGLYRSADIEATRGFRWDAELSEDHDLFGDGSVVVLRTPGHTPGHSSLLVRLTHRSFILTGDAVHLRTALEADLPMPSDHDTAASVASIRRLRRLRDSLEATVWISHDPEDWADLEHAPASYE